MADMERYPSEHLKEGEATIWSGSPSSCKDQLLFPSDSLFLSQATELLTTRSRCQPGLQWARENDGMLDVESKHNGSKVWEFDSERECLPDATLLKLWKDFVAYNKTCSLQKPISLKYSGIVCKEIKKKITLT